MTAPLTPPKGSSTTNGHATNGSTSASKPKSPPTPLRISTDVDKKPMSLFSRHGLSATSPLSAGVSDKIDTLHRGLSQLHDGTADSLIFRKLIRLAKETSPDIDPTLTESVWGANGEGFSALVTESITFLENEKDVAKKEYCILLVKQLLHCESALLGVDANALLRQLMICRTNDSHSVCSAAEDALDAFVSLTNHQVCLDALIHLLEGCVAHIASEARANGEGGEEEENESTNNDGEASSSDQHNNSTNDTTSTINFGTLFGVKSNPLATGFMLFSKLLRRSECTILSSEAVAKIVGLATEGLNNHTPEVRKSAVDLLVALHGIQGDQLDVYLTHLSVPQRKLVAVYINRNQIVR
ncbi:hypothetical protein BDF22DRAFT_144512 [Syncephalis plumigaleata]|nr:hypothetical protein BDF22DRAFT_144512 [Syncephalis plumigaleata]